MEELERGTRALGDAYKAAQSQLEEAAASLRVLADVFDRMTRERYEELGMPYGPDGLDRWIAENPFWLDKAAEDERQKRRRG